MRAPPADLEVGAPPLIKVGDSSFIVGLVY